MTTDARANRMVEIALESGGALRIPVTHCRACGAEIFFARTLAGGLMPLSSRPAPDGGFVVTMLQPPTVAGYNDAIPSHRGAPRFSSHFADCPAAGEFRKRIALRKTAAA